MMNATTILTRDTVGKATYRSSVMIVEVTFAMDVTGAMNFKQIMRYGSAIDVTPFIAVVAMKWTNATTVVKLYVDLAPHC